MRLDRTGADAGDDLRQAGDPLAVLLRGTSRAGGFSLDLPNADWPLVRPNARDVRVFTPRALLHLIQRAGLWADKLKVCGWASWYPRVRARVHRPPAPAPPSRIALVILCCQGDWTSAASLSAALVERFAEVLLMYDGNDVPAPLASHPVARVARLAVRPLAGDFAAQRNAAVAMTGCPWVFHLDADETPSAGLLEGLPAAVAMASRHGLRVIGFPRRNWVDGRLSEVYPDYQYRLHARGEKWVRRVHEVPEAHLRRWRQVWEMPAGRGADIEHALTTAGLVEKARHYETISPGAGRTGSIRKILGQQE